MEKTLEKLTQMSKELVGKSEAAIMLMNSTIKGLSDNPDKRQNAVGLLEIIRTAEQQVQKSACELSSEIQDMYKKVSEL